MNTEATNYNAMYDIVWLYASNSICSYIMFTIIIISNSKILVREKLDYYVPAPAVAR